MSFSMEVAEPEVIKAVIEEEVKPEPEEVAKLRELARNNVNSIIKLDVDSYDERTEILQSIEKFGLTTMSASSQKNNLLQVTVGKLSQAGDEGGQVAKGLSELHMQLKDLDPSAVDFAKSGLLGKLFNPLRSYFAKYQKAEVVISDIIESLD